MKQKSLLKTVILLCALVAGSASAWAEKETITFPSSSENVDKSSSGVSVTGTDVSVTISKGTGSNLATNTDGTRIYNGNSMVFTSSDKKISKIVFAYKRNKKVTNGVSADNGSFTTAFTVANSQASNLSATWEASNETTSAVTFTVGSGSGNYALQSAEVTFVEAAPSFNIAAQSNDTSWGTVSISGKVITASPNPGYRVSTTNSYTVTSGTATVSQDGNEFTVTPSSDCTVTINFEAIPTYKVTIETPSNGTFVVKNGEETVSSGNRFPAGTVLTITATPADNYYTQNWQAVDATTHTYTVATTYTMTDHDVTLRANFTAKHYVYWSVNGTVTRTDRYAKNETITLADAPDDIDGRTFVGWAEGTINGTTNEAPTFLTAPVMGTSDVTYYAVFASKELGENISATFKASDKSNLTKDANAYLYTHNETGITLSSTEADSYSFDVTTNNYYEITVDGYFTSIVATVYSSHPFSSTSAGTLTTSGSTQTITFGENDEVSTVRLTNNESNESWISQFVVNAVGYSYVDYCTTVVPDTRKIVNITGFSATTSPIVRGNTSTTTVSNDQDGWTPAYTYLSDNTDVATVDENGEITAVAKGTANITAKLNISKNDTEYKAGTTKSMSIEITVVNPSHDVVFYDNGTHLDTYDESYEEGDEIIFPDDPSIDGYYFIGWATDAIDGTTDEAPATVTAATMGNADVTYYAVYAIQTVGADEKFEYYKNTGSTGTSGGITVSGTTNSTASNGNPSPSFNTSSATIQISGLNLSSYSSASMKFDFKAGKVNGAYTTFTIKQFDSTNTELTSNTVTGTQNSSYVTSNEISVNVNCTKLTIAATAAKDNSFVDNIIVYAIRPGITYSGYRTSLTATISIASACTDGDMYYGTYSNSCAFIVSDDIIVSEISIVDGKLYVDDYESGDIVPANTGVMVSATEGGNYTVTLTSGGTSILGDDNCLRPSGDGGITAAAMSEAAANCLYYRLTMHGADPVNNIPGTIGFWWGAADGAAFSLAANKAYLAVPNEQETARMGFAFGDNTQGIDDVKRETITNDRYYNLQGQRISDIHKVSPNKGGLYIVNGKKVILK